MGILGTVKTTFFLGKSQMGGTSSIIYLCKFIYWWAAVYGVAQSQTQLQQLSSSSNKV